jgi:very-short-patch-repair endonuclease
VNGVSDARFDAKYAVWKERLLDLTASNRLLNFRETKVSTVQITSPDPLALFDAIVLRERSLKFPLYRGRTVLGEAEDVIPATEYRVTPGDLEAKKAPPDLERSLYRLTSLARTYREERGINTLYLAIGMLVWRPADSASPQRAPLVLVPVELTRQDRMHPYVLQPFDEDPEVNPTLAYMLRHDFEYALPVLPEEIGPESLTSLIQNVSEAVSRRGWAVETTAWLGQFQFRKLAMYRDLEEHASVASTNDRLKAVAIGREYGGALEGPSEDGLDEISPAEVFTALDADASQTQVIVRARGGEDLLVQGPPGTGKSQTIANLIAQFLLDGKKVLFVSEKMAALNVVHQRLRECGLGTFCLELHSDKANKRDTLVRIGRAAASDVVPYPAAERQFQELLHLRRELNAYVRALHQPMIGPRTAYNIHGALAALDTTPDVLTDFDFDPATITEQQEAELLERVARIGRFAGIYDDPNPHLFEGLRADRWSVQLQTEVAIAMKTLSGAATALRNEAAAAATLLSLTPPEALDASSDLQTILDLVASSPSPPRHWLDDTELDELYEDARTLGRDAARHHRIIESLTGTFDESFLRLDANALLADLSPDLSSAIPHEASEVRCTTCGQLNRIPPLKPGQRATCGSCKEALVAFQAKRDELLNAFELRASATAVKLRGLDASSERILSTAAQLAVNVGETAPADVEATHALLHFASFCARVGQAQPEWFDRQSLAELRGEVTECDRQHQRATALRQQIDCEFSDRIRSLPITDYHDALTTKFRGGFRWLRPAYWRVIRDIRSALRTDRTFSYAEATDIVQKSSRLLSIEQWFADRRTRHATTFGNSSNGEDTDWKALDARLTAMQLLHDRFADALQRPTIRTHLFSGGTTISMMSNELQRFVEDYTAHVADDDIRRFLPEVTAPSFSHVRDACRAKLLPLDRFISGTAIVREKMRASATTTLASAVQALADLVVAHDIERQFIANDERWRAEFGHLYASLNTAFSKIDDALAWAIRFRKHSGMNRSLADAACDSAAIDQAKAATRSHHDRLRGFETAITHVHEFFPADICATLQRDSFEAVAEWARVRADRIGELGDWLHYSEIVAECSEVGLHRFLDAARVAGVHANDLEPALLKAIRVRQLDAIYRALSPLRRFNVVDHESLVARFRQLDTDLMSIHRRRVQAAVTSRRPDLNRAGAGQSRFLRRELAKQRRHAPLRRLFQEAGRIILDLTPCLLMSPLSVATYLAKDAVDFDVAIFDEASQMPIEDAVGTIFRSRQLIVAGDTKQMPPSRFFERSVDDGADEDATEQPLESILEDCEASGMESRPLRWHYRSRHESLIAFSNAEFYDNRLITFPSPSVAPPRGFGIRFEYVADGVYDRGASRTNRAEARRVAQVVQSHLEQYPGQSLGVIALSSAQAQAIDEEIQNLLNIRPDLDSKLRVSDGDPFFVKSLENVQGDERDAMVISIGYAKDVNGKLALQFGPVSTDGGERRLNVAFTRARCQMIVVSSIRGGEINVAAVQKRGPKVLRRYLEYAENGVLPDELTAALADPESPFEDSVRSTLRDAGYEVDCQVGVSRYRIDLAVRHPNEPGHYLVGIECDGAAYHSSRVARDRDRLRQTVLEQRQWKIYRIWSTDWIRNRRATVERLLNHLQMLLKQREIGAVADATLEDNSVEAVIRSEIDVPIAAEATEGLGEDEQPTYRDDATGVYIEASLPQRHRDALYNGGASAVRNLILAVVEQEAPVHQSIVVVRIARAHGLQRAGHVVEETILRGVASAAKAGDISRKGEFLWPSTARAARPRRPAPGQPLRSIEHIAPEEIEEAAMLAIRASRGISESELTREAARVLGYLRTGERIDKTIKQIIAGMLTSGKTTLKAGFVVIS